MRIAPEQARNRLEWLAVLQVAEETIECSGSLVGGSIARDRFELACGDETLSGSVTDAAREQMGQFHLGQRVTARVRVRTVEHEEVSTEPAVTYVVEHLEPAEPPSEGDD